MIAAFGPRAQWYACGLPPHVEAIIADPEEIGAAYVEAVRRRSSGRSFYGMVLFDDPKTAGIASIAPNLIAQQPGDDERRAVLNAVGAGAVTINGKPASELFAFDPKLRFITTEFFTLCDGVLVRSFTEQARLSTFMSHTRPFERVLVEPEVPTVERRLPERPGCVLWAPERRAIAVTAQAFGLAEFLGDLTIVTGDAQPAEHVPGTHLQFGDPRVAEALATASCIVTADSADPGAAVAFARKGYGVVAPLSAGAHEFIRDGLTYDIGALRTLYVSVAIALGQPASVRETPSAIPPAPSRQTLPAGIEPPLVSVVIPTFNRREELRACLESLAKQTYPNVEAVVVNDGGVDVSDVAARFPFVRLHTFEQNAGMMKALDAGIKIARGTYLQCQADDDVLYPDHVERLVAVMLRSGAPVAHANGLIRHLERKPDGTLLTIGYNASIFNDTATPTEGMISTPIAGHALLWSTKLLAEMGAWREDSILCDQEIQLRALQRTTFAYVDHVTLEWIVRGGENFSAKARPGAEMRRIYEELHPAPDRPLLLERRKATLQNVESRPPGFVFPVTISLVDRPT